MAIVEWEGHYKNIPAPVAIQDYYRHPHAWFLGTILF